MDIEKSIEKAKEFINYLPVGARIISFRKGQFIDCQIAIATLLTAYEKEKETSHYIQSQLDIANAKLVEEKEKNKELTNSYNQAIKETNEENRRCMLLAVENQDLKEKNKELNILRLELLISQFPDTTETYKKYKKELDEILKEE